MDGNIRGERGKIPSPREEGTDSISFKLFHPPRFRPPPPAFLIGTKSDLVATESDPEESGPRRSAGGSLLIGTTALELRLENLSRRISWSSKLQGTQCYFEVSCSTGLGLDVVAKLLRTRLVFAENLKLQAALAEKCNWRNLLKKANGKPTLAAHKKARRGSYAETRKKEAKRAEKRGWFF